MDFIKRNNLTDAEIKQRLLAAGVYAVTQPYAPKAEISEFDDVSVYMKKPLDGIISDTGYAIDWKYGKYSHCMVGSMKEMWLKLIGFKVPENWNWSWMEILMPPRK